MAFNLLYFNIHFPWQIFYICLEPTYQSLWEIHGLKDETHWRRHLDDFSAQYLGTQSFRIYTILILPQSKHTEACERSIVSKMRLIGGDIWMISPLMRHSFLLSSNTVFMFSIQRASIGPSKITHFLSGVSVEANSRKVLATTPSVHCKIYHIH